MKYLASLLLLTSTFAYANHEETKIVYVEEDKYTWAITVENCTIDPTQPVKILTKQRHFPVDKVIVKQGRKTMQCEVEKINIVVA